MIAIKSGFIFLMFFLAGPPIGFIYITAISLIFKINIIFNSAGFNFVDGMFSDFFILWLFCMLFGGIQSYRVAIYASHAFFENNTVKLKNILKKSFAIGLLASIFIIPFMTSIWGSFQDFLTFLIRFIGFISIHLLSAFTVWLLVLPLQGRRKIENIAP
ncbi:MAG: hypothetical protein ACRDBH_12305 [Bosea sp. (in: a-proteobacteria)]